MTSHGPEPKTYETLLTHIKKIKDLVNQSEEIEKELIEGKDNTYTWYWTMLLSVLSLSEFM